MADADRPATPPQSGAARSELKLRILSSLVLGPAVLLATWYGSWPNVLLWIIAGVAVFLEWSTLVAGAFERRSLAGGALLAVAGLLLGAGWIGTALLVLGAATVAAAMLAPAGRVAWQLGGMAYAMATLVPPILLRNDPDYGFLALVVLFAVVWSTDIAAYFTGRALGGPKLWPRVSPKKTWSGALGGVAAAIVATLIVAAIGQVGALAPLVLVALVLSIVSQAGDLLESSVKRHFGAKDASRIIPGHGGVMDRLDGFLVAALVALFIGLAQGGLGAPARGLLMW